MEFQEVVFYKKGKDQEDLLPLDLDEDTDPFLMNNKLEVKKPVGGSGISRQRLITDNSEHERQSEHML